MTKRIIITSGLLLFAALNLIAQDKVPGSPSGEDAKIPPSYFKLEDPVTLSIGASGAWVRDTFYCTSDAVFLQMTTKPSDSRGANGPWDIALYGVHSPTEIVRFNSRRASGYREISPIGSYFAAESELVALAFGSPTETKQPGAEERKRGDPTVRTVLLTFDRKGWLTSSLTLDAALMPKQVAAFASGDLLFVNWDKLRQKTYLLVTGSDGDPIREINLQDHEPGNASVGEFSLWAVRLRAYGKNLLLIPEDPHRPILEVCETGVVRSYTLNVPKEYERWQPISFSRSSWKFRMISSQESAAPMAAAKDTNEAPRPHRGLEAMPYEKAVVMEFDPEDGTAVRQIELPESGSQPVCENNGEFLFLGIHPGDGKLTLGNGVVIH